MVSPVTETTSDFRKARAWTRAFQKMCLGAGCCGCRVQGTGPDFVKSLNLARPSSSNDPCKRHIADLFRILSTCSEGLPDPPDLLQLWIIEEHEKPRCALRVAPLQPDVVTFSALVSAAEKAQRWSLATQLLGGLRWWEKIPTEDFF